MNSKNTFKGEDAIINYLDPAKHVTPLVELPKAINPFYDDGIKIFAKLLQHTALANVKSIPAFNMCIIDSHYYNIYHTNIYLSIFF